MYLHHTSLVNQNQFESVVMSINIIIFQIFSFHFLSLTKLLFKVSEETSDEFSLFLSFPAFNVQFLSLIIITGFPPSKRIYMFPEHKTRIILVFKENLWLGKQKWSLYQNNCSYEQYIYSARVS